MFLAFHYFLSLLEGLENVYGPTYKITYQLLSSVDSTNEPINSIHFSL